MPRTADGQPDLQGIWTHNSATPFERPEQFGDMAVLTDEEVAELTQRVNEFRDGEQAGDLLGDSLIQKALDPTFESGVRPGRPVTTMRSGWSSVN